ncbi:hypothetical protein ACJIZ3_002444 [Penstemon smallii]|uniref:Uncharacterized protein n=1 Tax=Penstemon smallii TaxID=265156 RepID=A0ABD3U8A9_9LAMI
MDIGHGGSTSIKFPEPSIDPLVSPVKSSSTCNFVVLMLATFVLQAPIFGFIHYPYIEIQNLRCLKTRQVRCSKISELSLIGRTHITQYIRTKNPIDNSIKNSMRPVATPRESNFNGYYSVNMHIIHLPFTNIRKIYLTLCQVGSLATSLIHTHHNKTQENSIFDICHKTPTEPLTDRVLFVRGKGKPLPSCRIAYPKI